MGKSKLPIIGGSAKKEGAYVWKRYAKSKYIQGTGTQYIDTGFKPNNNTCYEIKYQTIPTQSLVGIMGAEHGWGNASFALWCKHAGFANSTISNQTWYGESPVVMKFDKGTLYKDGVQVWSASGTFQCGYNAYLFGINRAGEFSEPVDNLKIYYAKIWDNGTLVRDFIPYIDNGVAGMKDLVSGKFYGNSGSGKFTLGEDYTNLDGYVTSDNPSEYPEDGVLGNYRYVKFNPEKSFNVEYGGITLSGNPSSITIYHSLGVVPSIALIYFNNLPKAPTDLRTYCVLDKYGFKRDYDFYKFDTTVEKTTNKITFNSGGYPWESGTYTWIVIA